MKPRSALLAAMLVIVAASPAQAGFPGRAARFVGQEENDERNEINERLDRIEEVLRELSDRTPN